MDAEAIITALVAIYGALLATFTYFRDRRDRGLARVRAGYTALGGVHVDDPFVFAATIENHGKEPIFLASLAVESYPSGMFASTRPRKESPPLPVELRPGQSYTAYLDANFVHSVASYGPSRHVRITFYDQLRRRYRNSIMGTGLPEKTNNGWQLDTADPLSFGERFRLRVRKEWQRVLGRRSKPELPSKTSD